MTSDITPSRTTYGESVLLCVLESCSSSVFHIVRARSWRSFWPGTPWPDLVWSPLPTRSVTTARAQYGVLYHEGNPVDLVVDWDEEDRLRITVRMAASEEEVRALLPGIGVICPGSGV